MAFQLVDGHAKPNLHENQKEFFPSDSQGFDSQFILYLQISSEYSSKIAQDFGLLPQLLEFKYSVSD